MSQRFGISCTNYKMTTFTSDRRLLLLVLVVVLTLVFTSYLSSRLEANFLNIVVAEQQVEQQQVEQQQVEQQQIEEKQVEQQQVEQQQIEEKQVEQQGKRTVLMPARMVGQVLDSYFLGCQFSDCVYKYSDQLEDVYGASFAAIEYFDSLVERVEFSKLRSDQVVFAFAHEPQAYRHNQWRKKMNYFNGTLTFSRSSTIHFPWGAYKPLPPEKVDSKFIDYAKGKTKGAFAYVSNCKSVNYDRLKTIKEFSKYIDVDVYGKCTKDGPCSRGDYGCEAKIHKDYRFFLAFENSLCKDYISEKFWRTLSSPAHYVPVAIGGLSIIDYTDVAPPNSFVHAYNFTSIETLGKYLRHLMEDDSAYNRYHEWKERYFIDSDRHRVACDMCRIAHNVSSIRSIQHHMFADEWNNASNCQQHNLE